MGIIYESHNAHPRRDELGLLLDLDRHVLKDGSRQLHRRGLEAHVGIKFSFGRLVGVGPDLDDLSIPCDGRGWTALCLLRDFLCRMAHLDPLIHSSVLSAGFRPVNGYHRLQRRIEFDLIDLELPRNITSRCVAQHCAHADDKQRFTSAQTVAAIWQG